MSAHPFAGAIARVLTPGSSVLVAGVGSGRNIPVLLAAGLTVALTDARQERLADVLARFPAARAGAPATRYDAALATHALLHGTRRDVAQSLRCLAARLRPAGALYATFGSTRDPRCGAGVRIDARTWAPAAGAEAGVPHVFFDRLALEATLGEAFDVVSLEETSARETVGRWAHAEADAAGIVHWFALARARSAAI